MRRFLVLGWVAALGMTACDDGADGGGGGDTGGEGPITMTAEGPIPDEDPEALLAWLRGGGYLDWQAESGVHDGAGPHFGDVHTYINAELFESFEAGNEAHPVRAAAVKELYGTTSEVRGWTIAVKRSADSAGGDGWYWYEYFNGSVLADGDGLAVCTGCHSGGLDYVLTPFPLQ